MRELIAFQILFVLTISATAIPKPEDEPKQRILNKVNKN